MPRDRTVPRLADDIVRAWVAVGAGTVLSVPATLGYALSTARGVEVDELRSYGFSVLSVLLFSFVLYEILTWHTLRRATASQLSTWITKTTPTKPPTRLVRALNGGDATSWSAQSAVFALLVVIVLTFVPALRQDGLVVSMGLLVVIASWALVIFSYAAHYARENVNASALDFPGADPPVWSDYLYLSVQVSTTFSASDVTVVSTAMRRNVTAHCLIAFVFNTVIVALVVSALLTFAV